MTDPYPSLLDAALALHAAGLCVLPAAEDGSKRPAVSWKDYQDTRPTLTDLYSWFEGTERTGLGIVAGAVSGGLEMTELEGRCDMQAVTALVREAGEGELWDRLVNGFSVASPSGGVHLIYRVAGMDVPGNTKLAATASHVTMAETRGEGGWLVTAPSRGHVHPTKRPWQIISGGPATIPTLTPDERERLHGLLRALDERPVPEPVGVPVFGSLSRSGGTDGVSPGDDYAAKASWDEVLGDAGWRRAFTRGGITYWTRPGKKLGVSASTGYGDGDWLYVFTSSTMLEPERTYTRFGFYAAWHHGGDHAAAAKDLQGRGYGKAATVVELPVQRTPLAVEFEEPAPAEPAVSQVFGLTDIGNARLLVATHGHRLRYCPERGQWLAWNGWRWAWDDAGLHVELAKDVLEGAAAQATDKTAVQHYTRSMSRRGVEAVVALARTDPAIAVSISLLDAIAHVICTPAGVVDLRDGQVGGFGPSELHTRSTVVGPDKAVPTPMWDRFLADTYGDDTELVAYMQRLLGYCLTGEVSQHILPFLYGQGRNGKSVIVNVMVKLLGGYATTAPGSFLTQGHAQHETEIARLHGARFLGCSETEPGDRFAEAKVKMLTGGDPVTARYMRRDHFTYLPTVKLMLMANDRPSVASGGVSFWRRVQLIHHRFEVAPDRIIDGLDERLVREEGAGILAWLIEGAMAFYATGLRAPASVRAATAEYAAHEDDVGRFIAERLVIASPEARQHVQTPTTAISAAYHAWCSEEGVDKPMPLKRLGMELRRRCDVETYRANGRRFYLGVSLADAGTHWSVLSDNRITD